MEKIIAVLLFIILTPFVAFASDSSDKMYSEYFVNGKWVSFSKYVTYLEGKTNTFCLAGDKVKCDKYCTKYRIMAETEAPACVKKVFVPVKNVDSSASGKAIKEAAKVEEKIKQEELKKVEEELESKFEEIKKENSDFVSSQKERMTSVKNKNSFIKFLVGPGYKNVVQLRSEVVINRKGIDGFQDLLSQAQSDEIKNSIKIELGDLQNHQEEIIGFVVANENHFSLFGWVAKLFE